MKATMPEIGTVLSQLAYPLQILRSVMGGLSPTIAWPSVSRLLVFTDLRHATTVGIFQ